MDTPTTNPARRLHAELSAIDASWRKKPKERMKGVVLPDPPADLLGFVASMARTGREVVQALEATDAHVLPWALPRLEGIIAGLGSDVFLITYEGAHQTWLTEANLLALEAAAHALDGSRTWLETAVPKEALAAITVLLQDLRREVLASDDVPMEVRAFMLDTLIDLERALDAYRLDGIRAFQDFVDRVYGRYSRAGCADPDTPCHPLIERTRWLVRGIERLTAAYVVAMTLGWAPAPAALWGHGEGPDTLKPFAPPVAELGPGSTKELDPALPPDDGAVDDD